MTDKRFIEQFEENVQKYPDKVILRDEKNSLTFRELDELSGRVYADLKEKGIGREDFVMISLPRGVEPMVALLGVWKVGAAGTCVVEQMPISHKEFIYSDCNCRLNIDQTIWQSILSMDYKIGHEDTAPHDAAFVTYTSGSEGHPKGIIYEYGKLMDFVYGWSRNGVNFFRYEDIAGLPFPMQGTLYLMSFLNALIVGTTLDILPLHLYANPNDFEQYLIDRKISVTCVMSSFLEKYQLDSPHLRVVVFSMEQVKNVYTNKYLLINAYGQSEGATICLFDIDKPYKITPVGIPSDACKGIVLLDDNDHPVKTGETGELCYENPYTRGYINLPEETARAFRNGLYHTGDIARVNEDGNYVILGRKSDMIKINGNRIEPAEIETAVKKVLGIDWAFAKGFVEPERSFIVVYYTANIDIDYARVREELMKILPTYMIPSYFVHIDEVPHLPNGKVDRQAFKAPEIEQYRAKYVAPENELEERLCAEMEKVLGTKDGIPLGRPDEKRIGVHDDFYLLGGDSLRTIELVTNLGIEGLTVTDIYAARTPQAIAERWMQKMIAG